MSDEVHVFRLDAGKADILLAAGDFFGVDAYLKGSVEGSSLFDGFCDELKQVAGERVRIDLDKALTDAYRLPPPGEGATPVAFLMQRGADGAWAFTVRRPFDLDVYAWREFRLLPPLLRKAEAGAGLAAIRFAGGGRIQYLVDARAFIPGGKGGGA